MATAKKAPAKKPAPKKAPAKKAAPAKKPARKATSGRPAARQAPAGPACAYGDGKPATARGMGNAPVCQTHADEARAAGHWVNEL